jgi:hypothetical protein
VNEGNTLIVVNNIEAWAADLAQKEVIDYKGSKVLHGMVGTFFRSSMNCLMACHKPKFSTGSINALPLTTKAE